MVDSRPPKRIAVNQSVTIEGIAAGGDGVGHLENGQAIFVPRTAPGDDALVEIVQRKARFARGRLVDVVTPSPDRVRSRCRHYTEDDCGGCQLQHMSIESQQRAKSRIVGDAFRRIGKREVSDPEIVASEKEWRYRTKITVAAKGQHVGFRPYHRPDATFPLGDCLVTDEGVSALWQRVASHRRDLPSDFDGLVVRLDRNYRLHLVVLGGDAGWDAKSLATLTEDLGVSIWWQPVGGAARVLVGEQTGFPAVAFEQVNRELATKIRQDAVNWLGNINNRVAWDLYGGVGDFAEMMSELGARAWCVEKDRSALEWGQAAYENTNHAENRVTRLPERAEECLDRLPEPDVVVVNPPRTGLHPQVVGWLQRWGQKNKRCRLAYVSCDPATLARDVKTLPSFEIRALRAYDLFPQTGHVETLALLEAA